MEKKFYTDDFEQFLKETTDDFRMYPSKRVWNSLYNNLHPGRKWPSLSVCLILVSSIIFIGLSHKNEITGSANLVKNDIINSNIAYQKPDVDTKQIDVLPTASINNNTQSPIIATNKTNNLKPSSSFTPAPNKKQSIAANPNSNRTNHVESTSNNTNKIVEATQDLISANNQLSNSDSKPDATQLSNNIAENNTNKNIVTWDNINNSITDAKADVMILEKNNFEVGIINNEAAEVKPITQKTLLTTAKNIKSTEDKDWMDDYAFYNLPASSLKSKLVYELYLTPSVGYRTLRKNVNYSAPARSSLLGTTTPVTPEVLQNPGLNLEAGLNYLYSYSKSWRIKAGIQFNFTSYRIQAYELGHSTLTTLVLHDPLGGIELTQRSSNLSNLSSDGFDKKLNSSTFQASLPIGAELKLAGKHNLQWFAGATLQPTYVIFGNAYLISSDEKNYVYDAKALSKWNMNGAVETFLSYKAKNGITFNAGPQLRYQFFSTYKKKYSYDEKLYNVGLKIGVIQTF